MMSKVTVINTPLMADRLAEAILIDARVEWALDNGKPVNPTKIYRELLIDPILSEHKRILGGSDE